METARPRTEERLCGPRAGQLHFAIWQMYRRSATTRLSFLQRALISDAKFLLHRAATRFSMISGNALPIMTAGGWAIVLSCPIMCISLRGLKDRKSTRLNSSHRTISYAVFCLKKKKKKNNKNKKTNNYLR